MVSKHNVILHLSLIRGIGCVTIATLIDAFGEEYITDFYACSVSDFIEKGISEKTAQIVVQGLKNKALIEQELNRIVRCGASWTTCLHDDYPALLKNIPHPPSVLYWYGQPVWKDENTLIALVGSRCANAYGRRIVNHLVTGFVDIGWITVSGGAYGIDGMVHEVTCAAKGKTVVILGSGLEHLYPQGHIALFDRIIALGGAIVSSFSMDMHVRAEHFPARNRIISGMSCGSIVVQAAKKSGARITARYALEQGRGVYAVPGQFDDPLSVGCHALMQEGALPIMEIDDVLSDLGYHLKTSNEHSKNVQHPLIKACDQPRMMQELADICQLSLEQIYEQLVLLQLEGKIKQNFAGLWQRC